jgi:hypothetical protein
VPQDGLAFHAELAKKEAKIPKKGLGTVYRAGTKKRN